jgi:hypothetical protein
MKPSTKDRLKTGLVFITHRRQRILLTSVILIIATLVITVILAIIAVDIENHPDMRKQRLLPTNPTTNSLTQTEYEELTKTLVQHGGNN